MSLHDASSFNVRSTLNSWFKTEIDAWSFPAALELTFPGNRVLFDMPGSTAKVPAFSVHHTPVVLEQSFQGRRGADGEFAMRSTAFMDISAWTSRIDSTGQTVPFRAQLDYMTAIVEQVVTKTTHRLILDYAADFDSPANTAFKVNLHGIESQTVVPDPNPAIERVRILVYYSWILRSN